MCKCIQHTIMSMGTFIGVIISDVRRLTGSGTSVILSVLHLYAAKGLLFFPFLNSLEPKTQTYQFLILVSASSAYYILRYKKRRFSLSSILINHKVITPQSISKYLTYASVQYSITTSLQFFMGPPFCFGMSNFIWHFKIIVLFVRMSCITLIQK